jgi:hypothetical protein
VSKIRQALFSSGSLFLMFLPQLGAIPVTCNSTDYDATISSITGPVSNTSAQCGPNIFNTPTIRIMETFTAVGSAEKKFNIVYRTTDTEDLALAIVVTNGTSGTWTDFHLHLGEQGSGYSDLFWGNRSTTSAPLDIAGHFPKQTQNADTFPTKLWFFGALPPGESAEFHVKLLIQNTNTVRTGELPLIQFVTVPEPGTWVLCTLGMLVSIFARTAFRSRTNV